MGLPNEAVCQLTRVVARVGATEAGGTFAERTAFQVAPGQVGAQRDHRMDLVLVEAHDLCGRDGGAKHAEHGPGVKAARHHGRDPIGSHPLHHFVTRGNRRDDVTSRGALAFRGDERARDNCRARMRQHPKRVPLSASQHQFGICECGTAFRRPGAGHHDGGAIRDACFFIGDEGNCALPCRELRSEKCRRNVLQREALRTVDDIRRKIVVAQPHHPLGELAAERLRPRRRACTALLWSDRRAHGSWSHDSREPCCCERGITEKPTAIPVANVNGHGQRLELLVDALGVYRA